MENHTSAFRILAKEMFSKSPENLTLIERFAVQSWVNSCPVELSILEHYKLKDDALTRANLVISRMRKKSKKDYIFFTINPVEGKLTPQQFINMINAVTKYSAVDDFYYCIETRGKEDDAFKGMHCHCLIHVDTNNYRTDRISTQIRKKFLTIVGNALHINIQFVTRERVPFIRRYIEGYKNDKPKKNKITDQEFRLLHNIDAVYSSLYKYGGS